jgi:hypothetical protein
MLCHVVFLKRLIQSVFHRALRFAAEEGLVASASPTKPRYPSCIETVKNLTHANRGVYHRLFQFRWGKAGIGSLTGRSPA